MIDLLKKGVIFPNKIQNIDFRRWYDAFPRMNLYVSYKAIPVEIDTFRDVLREKNQPLSEPWDCRGSIGVWIFPKYWFSKVIWRFSRMNLYVSYKAIPVEIDTFRDVLGGR